MADNSDANGVTRRKLLLSTGTVGAAALAGCLGGNGDKQKQETEPLKAGGSSTVYPIASTASSTWNSNPPASDKEYWGPSQYGIDTEKNLADYFGELYGFESSEGSSLPFTTSVGLSHSGTGLEKLRKGQLDIGNSSAPVKAELPDANKEELDKFVNHVVGVDAQPIVVSREIKEAGVTQLTLEQLKGIYKGDIKNWSELPQYDGPDKQIQAVGRAEGSGTDTAFRLNVFGNPDAPIPGVDIRKGQNQQVKTLVANSNNAIAYLALAFVTPDGQVPPIALKIEDTVYEYGKNLDSKAYPLSRDLHMYTYEGTSKKEAAFLNMILTEFGQQSFVKPNDYVMLSEKRRKNQREKLPDPQQ